MCRQAMATRMAAKFLLSPSGVSSPGTWMVKSLSALPTQSIWLPWAVRPSSTLNRPCFGEYITLFQMNPTTASDSTTGR